MAHTQISEIISVKLDGKTVTPTFEDLHRILYRKLKSLDISNKNFETLKCSLGMHYENFDDYSEYDNIGDILKKYEKLNEDNLFTERPDNKDIIIFVDLSDRNASKKILCMKRKDIRKMSNNTVNGFLTKKGTDLKDVDRQRKRFNDGKEPIKFTKLDLWGKWVQVDDMLHSVKHSKINIILEISNYVWHDLNSRLEDSVHHTGKTGDPIYLIVPYVKDHRLMFKRPSLYTNNIDLRGADLFKRDLRGVDLRGVDLTGTDLRSANLELAKLGGANLTDAKLGGAKLGGVNLTGAKLERAELESANLRGANLTGANLKNTNLMNSNLENSKLAGADLSFSTLRGANLMNSNLANAYLEGAKLDGADLRGANLEGTDLRGAKLEGADLRGTDLRFATLEHDTLRGSKLDGVDLGGVDLRGVDLRGTELKGAKLDRSDLRGAKLGRSILRDAILRYANLTGTDLRGADLRGAKLDGAKLDGAELKGAKLDGAKLDGDKLDGGRMTNNINTFEDLTDKSFLDRIGKTGYKTYIDDVCPQEDKKYQWSELKTSYLIKQLLHSTSINKRLKTFLQGIIKRLVKYAPNITEYMVDLQNTNDMKHTNEYHVAQSIAWLTQDVESTRKYGTVPGELLRNNFYPLVNILNRMWFKIKVSKPIMYSCDIEYLTDKLIVDIFQKRMLRFNDILRGSILNYDNKHKNWRKTNQIGISTLKIDQLKRQIYKNPTATVKTWEHPGTVQCRMPYRGKCGQILKGFRDNNNIHGSMQCGISGSTQYFLFMYLLSIYKIKSDTKTSTKDTINLICTLLLQLVGNGDHNIREVLFGLTCSAILLYRFMKQIHIELRFIFKNTYSIENNIQRLNTTPINIFALNNTTPVIVMLRDTIKQLISSYNCQSTDYIISRIFYRLMNSFINWIPFITVLYNFTRDINITGVTKEDLSYINDNDIDITKPNNMYLVSMFKEWFRLTPDNIQQDKKLFENIQIFFAIESKRYTNTTSFSGQETIKIKQVLSSFGDTGIDIVNNIDRFMNRKKTECNRTGLSIPFAFESRKKRSVRKSRKRRSVRKSRKRRSVRNKSFKKRSVRKSRKRRSVRKSRKKRSVRNKSFKKSSVRKSRKKSRKRRSRV